LSTSVVLKAMGYCVSQPLFR